MNNQYKKFLVVAVIASFIFGYFLVSAVFAGGVTDNNNGNAGNILIHSGTTHGANDVGEWVDSSSFKGDKGDKGDSGKNGVDGENGVDGKKAIKEIKEIEEYKVRE